MGEYYRWVNVDKKEYLSPGDFDLGNKRMESIHKNNAVLCALQELLAADWKGDRIIFLGDECDAPENIEMEIFKIILKDAEEDDDKGFLFDTVFNLYRNISGLFKAAEKDVRDEIEFYLWEMSIRRKGVHNEYGVDLNDPYKDLFTRTGMNFKFILNHTKKCGYSLGMTKIRFRDYEECDYADPLPLLMSYGRSSETGEWLGDVVGVANTFPSDYTLLSEIFLDW